MTLPNYASWEAMATHERLKMWKDNPNPPHDTLPSTLSLIDMEAEEKKLMEELKERGNAPKG